MREPPAPPSPTRRLAPRTLLVLLGLAVLALLPVVNPPRYMVTVLTEVFIYAIFAMSLDLLVGYTGLPSLGHAAFWGLGAYAAGVAAINLAPSALLVVPLALLTSLVGALLIGSFCIRTSGTYFLMLTLAFSQMLFAIAYKWTAVTGGSNGLPIPRLRVPFLDLADGATLYEVSLAFFALALWLLWSIVRSPLGRTFIGIRENEGRMRALGYDTPRYKLAAFALAGTFAGLAGALFVAYSGFASPAELYWTTSGQVMVMVIIGGAGSLLGPALGAALVLLLQNWVSSLSIGTVNVGERWPLIMGLVFVSFVLFGRGGIVGLGERALRRRRRHPSDPSHPAEAQPTPHPIQGRA